METLNVKSADLGWAAMAIATGAFALLVSWVLLASEGWGMMGPGMGWGVAWSVLMTAASVTVIVISVVLILAAVTNEPEERVESCSGEAILGSQYARSEDPSDQASPGVRSSRKVY